MDEKIKELLDVYERFESTKSAQGALDFAIRNARQMAGLVGSVEFSLPTVQAVDMGLPSGRLWADRNVGAMSPEDPGLFFSWGNTKGKEFGKVCNFDEDHYEETPGAKVDGDLDAEHDAATVNMGAPWRMPTTEDFVELKENCNYEWCEQNGYYGMKFTSKNNGNSIFFSASGYGSGSTWYYRGADGYYWSSSFYSSRDARDLYFYSGGVDPQNYDGSRYGGFAVRAVQ